MNISGHTMNVTISIHTRHIHTASIGLYLKAFTTIHFGTDLKEKHDGEEEATKREVFCANCGAHRAMS